MGDPNRKIFVISDTHFSHENIIGYCSRPFQSAKEMDECIADNWCSVVRDCDVVYHLGDVYMGVSGREILPKLTGRKRLILGNHDNGKDQNLHAAFQKISMWRMFPEFGALLSHVPLYPTALKPEMVNVHGHIHNKPSPTELHINASVEAIGYRPIELEALLAKQKDDFRK